MSVTPEQLQQAIQTAVAAAAQQRQEAAAQMQQEKGTLRTQVQTTEAAPPPPDGTASLVDASARETRVPRRRHRLEGQKYRLSKLRVCLLCTVAISLGTGGEIGQPGAPQRNPYSSRGTVLHPALLHAGHAVQGDSPHASGECWRGGGPGSLESSSLTTRTDLDDAQRGSVARAPELEHRGRDRGTNGAVRPRHGPLRECKRRELPEQHPYRSCLTCCRTDRCCSILSSTALY